MSLAIKKNEIDKFKKLTIDFQINDDFENGRCLILDIIESTIMYNFSLDYSAWLNIALLELSNKIIQYTPYSFEYNFDENDRIRGNIKGLKQFDMELIDRIQNPKKNEYIETTLVNVKCKRIL